MEEETTKDSTDFDRTVIVMHAPPYLELFIGITSNYHKSLFNTNFHELPINSYAQQII